jgi:hypothetical protein
VAIDPKYLPEDPKVLQQMVLDLMAQLDRESAERTKIETLLRELLDAKRSRKGEQLTRDQLALFTELLQTRETPAEAPVKNDDSDDDATGGATGDACQKKRTGGRQALPKNLQRERIVHDLTEEESVAPLVRRICGPSGKRPASATNTFRRN